MELLQNVELLKTVVHQPGFCTDLFRKLVRKWRSQSQLVRITSLLTGSVICYLSMRYIYIKGRRKYYGLPPGMVGMPIIGHVWTYYPLPNHGNHVPQHQCLRPNEPHFRLWRQWMQIGSVQYLFNMEMSRASAWQVFECVSVD